MLHSHGSSNPLGYGSNSDKVPMHPYYTFKDLVTVYLYLLLLAFMVFFAPNLLSHPDNYIPANPIVTPISIHIFTFLLIIITIALMLVAAKLENEPNTGPIASEQDYEDKSPTMLLLQ
jgi:quinol-cytochrome oxidoreductase complex cytochrome b subunit